MTAIDGFSEDVSRKARWFYKTRGKLTGADANRRWHQALAHVEVLRASRLADRDPGGAPLKVAFELSGGGRKRKATVVHNPKPTASNGFATACVEVDLDPTAGKPALLKIQMLRGAGRRLSLSTTKVFLWDERLRRWHMVDQSGYSPASRCAWAFVSRRGVYAAIAFPSEKKAARKLGLERFAYYYAQIGVESGLTARIADYFDSSTFRRLITMDPGMPQSPAAATRHTKVLTSLHRESKTFRQSWRGQLPNGGLPEWHMIEHFALVRPELLIEIGVDDIVQPFPWIFRVANRVARWHPNGPDNVSGRVKSLAIHPSNGDVLYAGSANGGVWRSIDGGSVWTSLWTFQGSMAVGSIAIAPSAPNTIYAATGEDTPNLGPSYGGAGIYKSTDAGATWALKATQLVVGTLCTRIIVHPANPNIVYLASEFGVFKTTNGGDTWTKLLKGHASDLVMAHDRPNILYAGVWNNGLYKTVDGGGSWVRNTSDVSGLPFPTGTSAGWIKLAIGQSGPQGSDFVIAKLGENGGYTFATFNGGTGWGLAGGSEPAVLPSGGEYDTWTSMVAIHPKNDRRLYLGGVNLQYSDDRFFFHPTTGTHDDHHQVVFDPNNEAICYCCCDGGVFRSQDFGVTWKSSSSFLQATQLISLGVSQKGKFVVGSATQDQGVIQTDGSTVWQDFNGGNEWGMFVVDPNNSDNIYISPGPDDQLRRSADGGRTWSNPTRGLTDPWASQHRDTKPASFAHVAIRPGLSNFLIGGATVFEQILEGSVVKDAYGPFSRLYYSRDWGQTWWSSHSVPSKITQVAYAPTDASRAYASSESGAFYRNDHGGELGWFEPAIGANKPPLGVIMAVTVDPTQADTVYITYGNIYPNVYRSTDAGAHWAPVSGASKDMALPEMAVSALVVDPESSDILYVGADIGVFRSNDWGISWYPYNDAPDNNDLPQVIVTGLANRGTQLFASTLGRGLYSTFTSAIPFLQVLAVSYTFRNRLHQGIQSLRLTDGTTIYTMTRTEVIHRIDAGTDVFTVGKDGSRAEVIVMEPDREHPILYLQTVADNTTADNLVSLPRF